MSRGPASCSSLRRRIPTASRVIRRQQRPARASYQLYKGFVLRPIGDPSGTFPETKEARVRGTRTIAVALAVVFAALALPASALPQALTVETNGQTGDGSHSVAPVAVSQGNDEANAAADAGSGSGSAATAGTQSADDGGTAAVGCVDGAATAGDSGLDGSAGNCGSGRGGAAAADTQNGDTGALAGLGCIALGLFGSTSGTAGVGSCKAFEDGSDGGGGGSSGDDGGPDGSAGGQGSEDGSGSTAGPSGSSSETGPGGSGSGGRDDGGSGPCESITQLAGLAGPGSVPLWMLLLGGLASFASGTLFARRRSMG